MGVAILLCEEGPKKSGFRGFELFRREIPIRHEICGLCNNHCKIASAEVMGERAAYGFLCGRDYDVDHFVSKNRSGFDQLAARRRIFRSIPAQGPRRGPTVGIPAALHLLDDLPLWRAFFEGLGARVVTSERCPDPVATGKKLEQAEFCAPMAAYHAHVAYLAEEADWVFAPIYLEAAPGERGARRQYCYYTQYASALVAGISGGELERKLLRPLVAPDKAGFQNRARLYIALRRAWGGELHYAEVASALKHAVELHAERRKALREILPRELAGCEEVSVVLLGRPYSCLAPAMNKGIPDILASMGVKVFYQDMLPYRRQEVAEIAPLLEQLHWNYAASVLEAAQVIAKRPGLYPVLVTSFKCAPDSCARVLPPDPRRGRKAVPGPGARRARLLGGLRDPHRGRAARLPKPPPKPAADPAAAGAASVPAGAALQGKKLFLPNWDSLSCRLVAANLRREEWMRRSCPRAS
jgi:predicted nucleotide-binding protein (sugar kinase/HSP70/actin superfamily)